jgi:hypothetical protein
MGKKTSIPYFLEASAGAEGDIVIYEVEPARKFKLTSLRVSFPSTTNYELLISFLKGIDQIAPHKGAYRGESEVIEDENDVEFASSERLILHYENLNTTEAKRAFILLRGELE